MKTYILILLFIFALFVDLILIAYSEYYKSKRYKTNHLLKYKTLGFTKKFIFKGDNIKIDSNERNILLNYFENMSKSSSSLNFDNVKSNKLLYSDLKKLIPKTVNYIESDDFCNKISNIVKRKIKLTNDDNDRIFARSYINKSDSIRWHYDNNFSDFKRYTIIIPIYINNKNTSSLQYINPSSKEVLNVIDSNNNLYLYEGDKIYHRVTEQVDGGKRIVLIIPMYENNFTFVGKIKMFIKNQIFTKLGM